MIDETAASASSTPAENQLDWLLDASSRGPLPDGEIRQHLAPALLEAIGGPDGFNAALAAAGPLTLRETLTTQPDRIQAAVYGHTIGCRITVHVEAAGRVDNLRLTPDEPEPASWTEIDTRLAELGARVSFAAAQIEPDGRCHIAHGLDADTQRPIGSAFELYVLGALAQAVAEGRLSWNEQLAIRDDYCAGHQPHGVRPHHRTRHDRRRGQKPVHRPGSVSPPGPTTVTAPPSPAHRTPRCGQARSTCW